MKTIVQRAKSSCRELLSLGLALSASCWVGSVSAQTGSFRTLLEYKRYSATQFMWQFTDSTGYQNPTWTVASDSDFDTVLKEQAANTKSPNGLTLKLGPGTFTTKGIYNQSEYDILGSGVPEPVILEPVIPTNGGGSNPRYPYFGIEGSGMDGVEITTLRLDPNFPARQGHVSYVVRMGAYIYEFEVKNLVIDCNWSSLAERSEFPQNISNSSYWGGYKVGGISGMCVFGMFDHVLVKNFGSNGVRPICISSSGTEAFPLALVTGSFGQTRLDGPPPTPPLVIQNCVVTGFNTVNGGYCTGILVMTRDPSVPCLASTPKLLLDSHPGCQHYPGERESQDGLLAIVRNNIVRSLNQGPDVPGTPGSAIAFGCGDSELIKFCNNEVYDTPTGLNCDTVHVGTGVLYRAIEIADNKFVRVRQGINFGSANWAPGKFDGFDIHDNEFTLSGWLPAYDWTSAGGTIPENPCGWLWSFGIRLNGATSNTTVQNNKFCSVSPDQFVTGPNTKKYIPIWVFDSPPSPINAEYPGCNACDSGQYSHSNGTRTITGNKRSLGADNFNVLTDTWENDVILTIEGKVRCYAEEPVVPVPDVTLTLSGDLSYTTVTGSDGSYSVQVSSGEYNYTLSPSKSSDDPLANGVTTLDIELIRRHILALEALDSPYKILAADVNNSASVTTLDIALIRRLILGIADPFLGAGFWKFVRSDFVFADPQAPWTYESTRNYEHLTDGQTGQDFIAIKVGDANSSWSPPSNP